MTMFLDLLPLVVFWHEAWVIFFWMNLPVIILVWGMENRH